MTRNMELSDRNHVRTTKRAKPKRRRKVGRWSTAPGVWFTVCDLVFDGDVVDNRKVAKLLNAHGVTLPRGR